MNPLRHSALGASLSALLFLGTGVHAAQSVDAKFHARKLTPLPETVDPKIWSARTDGQRVAYVARENSTYVAIYDGKKMGPYRQLSAMPHKDLYFVASKYGRISRKGSNQYSASDGQLFLGSVEGERGPYQRLIWVNLPESDGVVYKARMRGKWFLHLPGGVSEPFDAIEDIHFLGNGRVLVARARIGERWFKLIDGKKQHPIDPKPDAMLASSDGSLLAYVTTTKSERRVVLNGRLGHVLARDTMPIMSRGGKHIAYVAARAGKEYVVLDDVPYEPRASAVLRLGWSRQTPIYTARVDDQYRLYRGNELENFSRHEIEFGQGGQLLATLATKAMNGATSEWWLIGSKIDARELHEKEPAASVRIVDHRIFFSPNGKRWAYFAERQDDGLYLVVDGKPERLDREGEIDLDSIAWSPDSAYVAYLRRDAGRTRIVQSAPASWLASRPADWFGARDGEWFDEIEDDGFQFARDDRLVYKARKGKKWYLVVGSRKSDGFDGIGPIILGPEGSAFSTGLKKGTEYALINHKTGSVVEEFDPLFGPSGDPIYLAKDDDKTFCVVGFFRQKRFDDVARTRMVLHPQEDAVAYAARQGDMWLVVANKKSAFLWDHVSTPLYSPDGEHLAYIGEIEDKAYLVLDEESIGPFDMVEAPVFSEDSRQLAFLTREGRTLSWTVKELYDGPAAKPSPKQVARGD